MLGVYGSNINAAFEPMLATLLRAKEHNPIISNRTAADRLADMLRKDGAARNAVAQTITDTIEALESQVEEVKRTRRRTVRSVIDD